MSGEKGDGKFRWYVACARDAELFDDAAETRDEALEKGIGRYGTSPFFLIEADKIALDYSIFSAESVLEAFAEHNETCWGEDGMELELEPEDRASLEAHLARALCIWMWRRDCTPHVFCIAEPRTVERICAAPESEGP